MGRRWQKHRTRERNLGEEDYVGGGGGRTERNKVPYGSTNIRDQNLIEIEGDFLLNVV